MQFSVVYNWLGFYDGNHNFKLLASPAVHQEGCVTTARLQEIWELHFFGLDPIPCHMGENPMENKPSDGSRHSNRFYVPIGEGRQVNH